MSAAAALEHKWLKVMTMMNRLTSFLSDLNVVPRLRLCHHPPALPFRIQSRTSRNGRRSKIEWDTSLFVGNVN